jgi:hypothetical protein
MKMSHKGVNPMGSAHPVAGATVGSDVGTHQGRSVPMPAGGSAKAAMIDGPFGGKSPA